MTYLVVALVSFLVGGALTAFHFVNAGKQLRSLETAREELERDRADLTTERQRLDELSREYSRKHASYDELAQENLVLKRDLSGIDISLHKLELDRDAQTVRQEEQDRRSRELAERYLRETEKWVGQSINANNYAACKQRLSRVIDWCRAIGFEVPNEREEQLLTDLKADFERAVRAALEREEQARIKAQIREEQAREREIERELKVLEREREAIHAALVQALADAKDQHSEEVERLKARLAEAEQRSQRAMSQAQVTKAGHIYIISNIGSFGENVFKIGMTRRLEPVQRVRELGDASVPFPFDVHMMISCADAPTLENQLHRAFHRHRVNKVNPRKEYFRVDLEAIRTFVEANHGEINYVADAEALEYRQSLEMTDEDGEYILNVFERAEEEAGLPGQED